MFLDRSSQPKQPSIEDRGIPPQRLALLREASSTDRSRKPRLRHRLAVTDAKDAAARPAISAPAFAHPPAAPLSPRTQSASQ
jgi:hypothetical protein